MRDPNRIPIVLAAVERAWREHPDLRLGQVLTNAVIHERPFAAWRDLFIIEDDVLLQRLTDAYDLKLDDDAKTFVKDEPEARATGWAEAMKIMDENVIPAIRKLFNDRGAGPK